MEENMNKISAIVGLILLSSCSTSSLVNVKGVNRMALGQKNYEKPNFFMGSAIKEVLKPRTGRSIASVNIDKPDELAHLSNRQLYFLNTYQQFKALGKITGKGTDIKACPAFHDVLLKNDQSLKENSDYTLEEYTVVRNNPENIYLYPVLATPYSDSQDLYSVLVENNWENSKEHTLNALTHFHKINKDELHELCDTGVSAGYFVYENLVTYFKADTSLYRTTEGVEALLKVPVVASLYITDSLRKNSFWSQEAELIQSLFKRVNGDWFNQFRKEIQNRHHKVLSARLDF